MSEKVGDSWKRKEVKYVERNLFVILHLGFYNIWWCLAFTIRYSLNITALKMIWNDKQSDKHWQS